MKKFIHITGSIPRNSDDAHIELTRDIFYTTATCLLQSGFGVVALVGSSVNDKTIGFDDEIIQAAADYVQATSPTGVLIKTVRNRDKWTNQVSQKTLRKLIQIRNHIEDEALPQMDAFGGQIREAQCNASDGAIVIGGLQGVNHTARMLMDEKPPKPIVEIFIPFIHNKNIGLQDDIREELNERNNWRSHADSLTITESSDVSRVSIYAVSHIAKLIAEQSRQAEDNNHTDKQPKKPSFIRRFTASRISAATGLIRLSTEWLNRVLEWTTSRGG